MISEPNKKKIHLDSGNTTSTGFPNASEHHLASRKPLFYFKVILLLYSKNLVNYKKFETKQNLAISSVRKNVEQLELTYIACRNAEL